ncbi:hypothetical protein [Methylobacterium gossipiicola]|uniref:hypothetical protein n=1 Tax=Methylobacterium gossipiicola TaxID=582675 RepID=UPI0011607CAE|nr:hypothetical protein [Methylobacterium gossipiicola]
MSDNDDAWTSPPTVSRRTKSIIDDLMTSQSGHTGVRPSFSARQGSPGQTGIVGKTFSEPYQNRKFIC